MLQVTQAWVTRYKQTPGNRIPVHALSQGVNRHFFERDAADCITEKKSAAWSLRCKKISSEFNFITVKVWATFQVNGEREITSLPSEISCWRQASKLLPILKCALVFFPLSFSIVRFTVINNFLCISVTDFD